MTSILYLTLEPERIIKKHDQQVNYRSFVANLECKMRGKLHENSKMFYFLKVQLINFILINTNRVQIRA